jgi:hypothetical protein
MRGTSGGIVGSKREVSCYMEGEQNDNNVVLCQTSGTEITGTRIEHEGEATSRGKATRGNILSKIKMSLV